MYLLRCSQGHEIAVTPKSAGGTVECPLCGEQQAVPKLGELRKLPRTEEIAEGDEKSPSGLGFRISFALLMLVALAGAVVATFAAFRWQSLPLPNTTDKHVAQDREGIAQLNPIQLIEAWNEHEQHDLSRRRPRQYHVMAEIKAHWKKVCLIALGVAVVSLLGATGVAIVGRRRRAASDT